MDHSSISNPNNVSQNLTNLNLSVKRAPPPEVFPAKQTPSLQYQPRKRIGTNAKDEWDLNIGSNEFETQVTDLTNRIRELVEAKASTTKNYAQVQVLGHYPPFLLQDKVYSGRRPLKLLVYKLGKMEVINRIKIILNDHSESWLEKYQALFTDHGIDPPRNLTTAYLNKLLKLLKPKHNFGVIKSLIIPVVLQCPVGPLDMVSLIGKIFPEQFSDGSTYIVMKDAIGKMNYISALVESNMIMVPSDYAPDCCKRPTGELMKVWERSGKPGSNIIKLRVPIKPKKEEEEDVDESSRNQLEENVVEKMVVNESRNDDTTVPTSSSDELVPPSSPDSSELSDLSTDDEDYREDPIFVSNVDIEGDSDDEFGNDKDVEREGINIDNDDDDDDDTPECDNLLDLFRVYGLNQIAYQRVLFDNGYKIGNIVAFDEIAGLGLTGTAEDVPTPVRTKDWVGYQKVTKADGEGFIFASKHPAAGFDHGANSFALMILGLVQTLLLSTTSTDFWRKLASKLNMSYTTKEHKVILFVAMSKVLLASFTSKIVTNSTSRTFSLQKLPSKAFLMGNGDMTKLEAMVHELTDNKIKATSPNSIPSASTPSSNSFSTSDSHKPFLQSIAKAKTRVIKDRSKGKEKELNEEVEEQSDVDYFNSIERRISTEAGTSSSTSTSSNSNSNEIETEVTGFYLPEGSPPLPSHITSREKLINKSTTARKISPEVIKSRRRIPSIQGVLGLFNPPSLNSSEADDSDLEERDRLEIPEEEEEKENEREEGRKFSKEEAWYFSRALVGEELRKENKELWNLKNLELNDDSSSTPILRYLIKNFLLTMPLIRDTTIKNSSGEGETEEVTFWTKGIQPLLASFHTLELSHSMELGTESKGLPTMIYSDYLARAVERFVSAGLKLSYGNVGNEATSTKNNFDNLDFSASTTPSSPSPFSDLDSSLSNIARSNSSNNSTIKSIKKTSEIDAEKDKENRVSTSESIEPKPAARGSRFSLGFLRGRWTPSPLSPSPVSPPPAIPLPELPNPITTGSPSIPPPLVTESSDSSLNGNLDRFSISSSEDGSSISHAGQVSSSWFSWIPSAITGISTHEVTEEKVEEIDGKRASDDVGDSPTIGKADDSKLGATKSRIESRIDNPRLSTASTTSSSSTPPLTPPPFLRNKTLKSQSQSQTSIDSSPLLLDSSFAASRRVPSVSLPDGMNITSSNFKKYVEKSGVPWPFGSRTSVWRDIDVNTLKWGGFEVDIVGVRSSFFSSPEFILRVRRPARLDEIVLRTQAQFVKYFRVLDREFPNAHVKRIPTTINPKDDVELSAQSVTFNTRRRTTSDSSIIKKLPAIVETSKAESRPASPVSISTSSSRSPTPTPTTTNLNVPSAFVRQLQAQSSLSRKDSGSKLRGISPDSSIGKGLNRTYSIVGEQKGVSSSELSKQLSPSIDSKQPYDIQRRALRNWLRDTLAIKGVGHHEETGEFLLLGSIIPKEIDNREVISRKAIDKARKSARLSVASTAKDKLSSLHTFWLEVEKEFIYENGFTTLSDTLRNTATIDKLPIRYLKAIDWLQMGLAETIYELFIASEASETIFKKLKAFHEAFPYFLVRQAFKLPVKNMTKVLQDILISRPFGGKSLLQKLISIFLDDDPVQFNEKIRISQSKIDSQFITSKLDSFVYSTEDKKEFYRKLAVGNDCELVTAILIRNEKSSIPLPSPELLRVRQAHASYYDFTRATSQILDPSSSNDSGVQLMLELKNYLRLKCQERDSGLIRKLLGEVSTGLALEELGGPLMELIKRIHKVGSAGQAVLKIEEGLDQFIVVIEALRSRLHDSSKSIRIISNLLSRQQATLYSSIHSIHRGDTLIEEFLSWSWTASVFINRGFAQSIDLEKILPRDAQEQQRLMKELEELVNYHKQKRMRQYQNGCRVLSGDVDGDSVVIVKGDGEGRSVVTPSIEKRFEMPRLKEIPQLCLEAFTKQIQKIFAV